MKRAVWGWVDFVASRGALLLVAVVLVTAIKCAVGFRLHVPFPGIHDEFAYLLAADTFAHGRLANPPHPMALHLQTHHVLQAPSYASKYPPAQGMILAAGQVLGGNPLYGLWLSAMLASAAFAWMLLAWMPPRWALLGGVLAPLLPILDFWTQSYWGGHMAFVGSALFLGALRRTAERPTPAVSIAAGIGLALLANSRPFEGVVLVLASVILLPLLPASQRTGIAIAGRGRSLWAPLGIVLLLSGVWMGFYNLRVTGSPALFPYALYAQRYGAAPAFVWQAPRPERFSPNPELRRFQEWEVSTAQQARDRWPWGEIATKLRWFATWYLYLPAVGDPLGYVLYLSLIAFGAWLRQDAWDRYSGSVILLFLLGVSPESWFNSHYTAPVGPLILAVLLVGARRLAAWRPKEKSLGAVLAVVVLLLVVKSFAASWMSEPRVLNRQFAVQRVLVMDGLRQKGGKHLLIVRYSPEHNVHEEWVYNAADIDASPVVFARDMSREQNQELIDYFRDRKVWLIEPDRKQISPYR